jgi:hypothetical protein
MQTRLVIGLVTTLGLVSSLGVTLFSQNTFAQNSNTSSANDGIRTSVGAYASTNSGAGGASSGTSGYNSNGGFALGGSIAQSGGGGGSSGLGGGSTGQSGGGGGSSGGMIGVGSTGQTVDRHLFCNTGMITPICK